MNRLLFLLVSLAWILAVGVDAADAPRVVMMIGEDEYHTWETLPEFAKSDLEAKGVPVKIIQADANDKNNFPGLVEALRDADVLLVSVRRRTPPKEQLDAVRAFIESGKGVVGIRTASHAFAVRKPEDTPPAPLATWNGFDPEVLGGSYKGHHKAGPNVTVTVAPGAEKSPLLNGVDAAGLENSGSLYQVSPVADACSVLLLGTIPGQPAEPVAWTRLLGSKQARIFYTSLGHPDNFKQASFRRLLTNALAWAAQKPVK